jgi:hypothetical protein
MRVVPTSGGVVVKIQHRLAAVDDNTTDSDVFLTVAAGQQLSRRRKLKMTSRAAAPAIHRFSIRDRYWLHDAASAATVRTFERRRSFMAEVPVERFTPWTPPMFQLDAFVKRVRGNNTASAPWVRGPVSVGRLTMMGMARHAAGLPAVEGSPFVPPHLRMEEEQEAANRRRPGDGSGAAGGTTTGPTPRALRYRRRHGAPRLPMPGQPRPATAEAAPGRSGQHLRGGTGGGGGGGWSGAG